MGRIRTVKPELFTHEDLFTIESETKLPVRLAFVGLFTVCDREGRFKWEPNRIKLAVLPYDPIDFSRVLDALLTRGMVGKYEVEGRFYGFIPTFGKHQVINNRESSSDLPEPNEINTLDASSTRAPRVNHASPTPLVHAHGERKGKERKGMEEEGVTTPSGDDYFSGIDEQVVSDFKALRKQKKAAITKTAINGIATQAAKAGMSLEDALRVCCSRGWVGFNADWVLPSTTGSRGAFAKPPDEKFHLGNVDRSGDQAAMELSMKHHDIVVEDGDIPF